LSATELRAESGRESLSSKRRQRVAWRLAYAAPVVPVCMLWAPMRATIPALYARYGSVGLKESAWS
jgi:hypothetical protein